MSIELTEAEMTGLRTMIRWCESWARGWRWWRWVLLLLAIGLLLASVAGHVWLERIESRFRRGMSGWLEKSCGAVESRAIEQYVNMRTDQAVSLAGLSLAGLMAGGSGLLLMMVVLMSWRRHLRDSVFAKLLRAELARMSPAEPAAGMRAKQDGDGVRS